MIFNEKDNILQQKIYKFAARIVRLCMYLHEDKKEYVLSKQLIRYGTSIGVNVEEAIGEQREKDFFAKLTISYREAR